MCAPRASNERSYLTKEKIGLSKKEIFLLCDNITLHMVNLIKVFGGELGRVVSWHLSMYYKPCGNGSIANRWQTRFVAVHLTVKGSQKWT